MTLIQAPFPWTILPTAVTIVGNPHNLFTWSTLMTVHGMHREASIEINASPEAVYDLISNLPRMGEWSPENIGGEWQHGGTGKVGDRFLGHNRAGERSWSVPVMVTVAERGRCFEFVTHPDDGPYVRWTYRMEPWGTGTHVTEIWDVEQLSPGRRGQTQAQLDERSRYTEVMLEKTLAALKKTAEG
jgi:polyketide cyclase/dehydrase/lipid transport protein